MLHGFQLEQSPLPYRMGPIYDPGPGRAERFAEDFGGTAVSDPAAVLDADAVFVCTWTSEHRSLVARCVEAGLPLFCEKPLGVDLDDARAVADLVDGYDRPTMVGLVLRSSPAMLAVRELLGGAEFPGGAALPDGAERSDMAGSPDGVGQVISVVFRDDQFLPNQGMYGSSWRTDRAKAGSGVLLEHSIHDLDLIEWLFGPVTSVSALDTHVAGVAGIEDSVAATFRLAAGGTASLTSVWHQVLSRPSQRHLEIFCERAMIEVIDDFEGPVKFTGPEPDAETRSLAGAELSAWLDGRAVDLRSAETKFLAALGGDEPPLDPGFGQALRAHVVADAAYASAAAGGGAVEVPRMG